MNLREITHDCEYGCEAGVCGHLFCEDCQTTAHSCANCDGDTCECNEHESVEGKNGITYCSQDCADRDGESAA